MTDEYVGMANHSVREIIDHLRGRVKLTTANKARMRNEINFEWDQTQDLATYFIELKKIRARLRRWGVEIDDDTFLSFVPSSHNFPSLGCDFVHRNRNRNRTGFVRE
jgi:hypothetical protein